MQRAIGIVSIKGGVGKTTAVSNLAAALANQFNKKVLVVDANFSAPNLGIHYGVLNPSVTIHDVLSGQNNIEEAVTSSGHGFDIIPGKLNFKGRIETLKLKEELNKIKGSYDFILIDSSPNLNHEMLATLMASDVIFAVTTPDFPTLSCTMHAVKVAKEKKTPIGGLLLNRVYGKKFELSIDDIEKATEVPVLAVIPHDVSVLEALSKNVPAHLHKNKRDVAIGYNKLAAMLCGKKYEDTRLLSKVTGFFNKDKKKEEVNRTMFGKK
jgi:septum site-determining protein MinD